MQLTASSEKMTIHSASGAGAKRQARDAAHIAGDWNAQDGAGSEGLWFKWKSAANFLLIKWWSIITLTLHVFNICLHSNVPLRSQHSNVGLRRGHSFLSESIGRIYRKSGGPAAVWFKCCHMRRANAKRAPLSAGFALERAIRSSRYAVATGSWGQSSEVASTSSSDRGAPPCPCSWSVLGVRLQCIAWPLILHISQHFCSGGWDGATLEKPWCRRPVLVLNEMTVWNVHSSWCWLGNLRPWTCKLPWSRTCCCCWTHVAIFDSCILQDVIESFALRGDFLPELRDDRQHSFFKGLDVADTTSVQALEANQEFLMEMCATLAPELAIAPHYAWKARW